MTPEEKAIQLVCEYMRHLRDVGGYISGAGPVTITLERVVAYALREAYERGRRQGLEEAAGTASAYVAFAETERIIDAIRALATEKEEGE